MRSDLVLNTNDIEELKSCLKTILRELPLVSEDLNVWKIIIMLQHNAQQAAMVRALRQGDVTNVMTNKSKKDYLEFLNGNNEEYDYGKSRLLTFNELYKRIKNPKYMKGKPFIIDSNSDMQMIRLNNFRNEFIHFLSSGWTIPVYVFPKIIEESNKIITVLFGEYHPMLLLSEKDRLEILDLVDKINQINNEISHDYVV